MIQQICILACICAGFAAGQSGLSPPLLGLFQDQNRTLRLSHGLAGNFLMGVIVQQSALNWAFSGRAGIVKTDEHLLLLDANGTVARSSVLKGDALVALNSQGNAALYYLPEAAELWRVGAFRDLRVEFKPDPGEDVRSVAAMGPLSAILAVCRGNDLNLISVDFTGRTAARERASGIHACPAVLVLPGKLLYSAGEVLVVRDNDGEEHRVKLAHPIVSLHQMGDSWIEIQAGTEWFALQLAAGIPRLFQLPQAGLQ